MKPTLILVIALGLVCQNLTGSERPKSTDSPVDTLKEASLFCIGGFGYAGTISPGEKALRELMKRTDAKLALIKLLEEATPEGQMYALVGLKAVEPAELESRLNSYRKQSGQVRTARGCILSNEPISHVVKEVEAGQFDLLPDKGTKEKRRS